MCVKLVLIYNDFPFVLFVRFKAVLAVGCQVVKIFPCAKFLT